VLAVENLEIRESGEKMEKALVSVFVKILQQLKSLLSRLFLEMAF
jgi:hypothetical protein